MNKKKIFLNYDDRMKVLLKKYWKTTKQNP